MTCDERLEALLNRAGQTISDLPKDYLDTNCIRAYAGVQEWRSENNLSTQHDCEKYILHLTDIIDRMETALENVCGERDYLEQQIRNYGYRDCKSCAHRYDCEQLSEYCCGYAFGGVPEGWSADDE